MAIQLEKANKRLKKQDDDPVSSFSGSGKLVRKADTEVVVNQPLQVEDEFRSLYETQGGTNVVVEPPFNMLQLMVLCGRNNVLMQCVHAMEVNVDGTGHTIEPVEEKKKSTVPPFQFGKEGDQMLKDRDPSELQPEGEGAPAGQEGQVSTKPWDGKKQPEGGEGDRQGLRPEDAQQQGTSQDGRPKPSGMERDETENVPLTPEEIEREYQAWLEAEGSVATEEEKKKKRNALIGAGDRTEENPTTEFKVQKFFGRNAQSESDKPDSGNQKDAFGKPFGTTSKPPFGKKPPFGPEGEGQEGVPGEEDVENDPEWKKANDFFKEPYPGIGMTALRRLLRVDLEQTGNAYLEVVRNIKGEVMLLRHLPSYSMRLVRLDPDPIMVTKKIVRNGGEVEVQMPVRERRFVQKVGAKKYYYREFGASRQVNRDTGDWAKPDEVLEPTKMASEVLYFKVDNDAGTPYGIPRWINNLPSVLGSRKAEEYNLDFFDAGGLPPALIIVEGGAMTSNVRDQLLQHMAGKGRTKHRAAVVEVQSTGGSIDRPGRVTVKVERFGDAKQSDSLFQEYDVSCAEHVRRAFRLAPLFLGDQQSYSHATAAVSYMVTEAQVFAPERGEFDDVINNTIMKELQVTKFKFVSKPVTLKNVELMLKGVEMSKELITGEELIDNLNNITGLTLNYSPEVEKQNKEMELQMMREKMQMTAAAGGGKPPFGGGKPGGFGAGKGADGAGEAPKPGIGSPSKGGFSLKSDPSPSEIVNLVNKWCVAVGLEEGQMGPRERNLVMEVVDSLDGANRDLFDRVMATKSLTRVSMDLDGLSSIAGVARKRVHRH